MLAPRHGQHPRRNNLGRRDNRMRLNRGDLLETAKTPTEQRSRFVSTRLSAVGVEDHRNEAHSVALGRGDQAETGLLGVARLKSINAGIRVEQGVAVPLLDAVVLELALRVDRVIVNAVADDGARQDGEVMR